MTEQAEVFEIWDKFAHCRAVELVFPTAQAAFDWLAPSIKPERKGTRMPGDEYAYRVQSIRMWQPAARAEREAKQ